MDEADLKKLKEAPEFRNLLQDPGFAKLCAAAREVVMERWRLLLIAKPDEIQRIQGFIEGANYFLEFADAKVTEAQAIADRQRADREEALREREAQQTQRVERRLRNGATL